jgi:hypothetical protein
MRIRRVQLSAISIGLLLAMGVAPASAEPKALISLSERDPNADRTPQPWPSGVRIVLYEDGQVLALTRLHYKAYDDEITWGSYPPEDARKIAAQLATLIGEQPGSYYGGRSTTLKVWDEARQSYLQWDTGGHPCLPPPPAVREIWSSDAVNREALDPPLAEACDLLANLRLPKARLWRPEMFRVVLNETTESREDTPSWPAEWSISWLHWPGTLDACVPAKGDLGELSRRIGSTDGAARRSVLGTLVKAPDGKIWKIAQIEYALPGLIGYEYGRGSDDQSVVIVSWGSCTSERPQ